MQAFEEILIIGLGLMGGSLALALKKAGITAKIVGHDVSKKVLLLGKKRGIIDYYYDNLQTAAKEADLIVMAVPVGYYREIFEKIGPYLSSRTIVTDLGSVKGYVEKIAREFLPRQIQFLGGHPMAGSEKGGLGAASPFLYENAYFFLTPNANSKGKTITKLKELVVNIGAYPVVISPDQHDRIVAQISHMPHLTAALLTNLLAGRNSFPYLSFVGGGFRDSTRIAAGNPNMWRDIFLYNRKEILSSIGVFEDMLQDFKGALLKEKEEIILDFLARGKKIRDGIGHVAKDYIPSTYDIVVDAEDRPGTLGDLTRSLGENKINIKQIEILHAREGEHGAIRIAFAIEDEAEKAVKVLRGEGFSLAYRKGGN